MKKWTVFLVVIFGLFLDGISQSYYIKHENVCRGSSYQWIIYDAFPTDTITYRSRVMVDGSTNWIYDTIVGNTITLLPNDNMTRFEILSINNDPNVCKERLLLELYGFQGSEITVNDHSIVLPDAFYVKIINASNQQVYNVYTSTNNTVVSDVPSGNYNIVIIDDALFHCPVTIPVTIP